MMPAHESADLPAGILTSSAGLPRLNDGANSQPSWVFLTQGGFMALTPSQKPTREWPLLILTLGLVGVVCVPLWQMLAPDHSANWASWDAQRWGRLLLGPEQIACYVCFLWGS